MNEILIAIEIFSFTNPFEMSSAKYRPFVLDSMKPAQNVSSFKKRDQFYSMTRIINRSGAESGIFQWSLLLTWFNFNPSMDK